MTNTLELVKKEDNMFNNLYEGDNGNTRVTCILDDYCVRYIVKEITSIGKVQKVISKHYFSNDKKDLCFKNATKRLNK